VERTVRQAAGMSLDAPLVRDARALARDAHASQRRKDGVTPYFRHLESVAERLAEHGVEDAHVLAAAYLHDLVEDQPDHAARMRAEMPAEVLAIVGHLTERKLDEHGRKRDKRDRFRDYLQGLRADTDAARAAAIVSCADKIDNVRSLIDAERERPTKRSLLTELSTRPDEHRTQLHALRAVYAEVVPPSLLATFDAARDALEALLARWVVGYTVALAAEAHVGRVDDAGRPFIERRLRLWTRASSDEAKMAAVLSGVLEDSPWTLEALAREAIPRRVRRALEHLTRRAGERGEAFEERVARDKLATEVRVLELEDELDFARSTSAQERVARCERALARLRPELDKRTLYVVLDEASQAAVRALAKHRDPHGDHVTLAFRVEPTTYDPAWVPGSPAIGSAIAFRAVGHARDERVQALAVELAGTTTRPYDGGILHVTVSTAPGAEPSESNELLAGERWERCDLELRGTLQWVD
jgi:hypothetical protein